LAIGTTSTVEPAGSAVYRGRFAPSPSGPLHFGSLVAAVGSHLEARTRGGEWLVRMEDLDLPRVRPRAADTILRQLEALGLSWDGPVWRQSERGEAYAAALRQLARQGRLRECHCSRSELAALPENRRSPECAPDELFHPAACVSRPAAGGSSATAPALRLCVPSGITTFVDRSLGRQSVDVAHSVGDFVVGRRDGCAAYQLAVVVDDAEQGVTDVVRGSDLLTSTPRQMLLQDLLGLPRPGYLHLPLAVDGRGRKLSKSEDAPAVAGMTPAAQVVAVLEFLGQSPPPCLGRAPLAEVWDWARTNWHVNLFGGRTAGAAPQGERAGIST
jgi:glutamyl-Q tRNA(Asp) synthetase